MLKNIIKIVVGFGEEEYICVLALSVNILRVVLLREGVLSVSVFTFTRKQMGRIGESILYHRIMGSNVARDLVLNEYEKYMRLKLSGSDAVTEKDVYCFVDRLWIANQMAFAYTYERGDEGKPVVHEIERLSEEDFSCLPLGSDKFLSELNSLKYNTISNGGNTFLGVSDQEKLDQIINALTSFRYRELVREQKMLKKVVQ